MKLIRFIGIVAPMLVAGVCLVSNPLSARPTDPAAVIDIPKLDGIVINGNSDDWSDRGYRVEVVTTDSGDVLPPEDLEPRFRLAWNDKGLLVLCEVRDDIAHEAEKYGRMLKDWDSVQVVVARRVGSKDFYLFMVSPGIDPKVGKPRFYFDKRISPKHLKIKEMSAQVASSKTDDGYLLEIMLPWSNLDMAEPEGDEIALQLTFNDMDGTGSRYVAQWYPNRKMLFNRMGMYAVRLSRATSAPMTIVARPSYAPGNLPWIRVVGTRDHVGQDVRVLSGERVVASGRMKGESTRAVARLLKPLPSAEHPLDGLAVVVGGQVVGDIHLPEADPIGTLRVRTTQESSETALPVTIRADVGADDVETVSEAQVKITVLDVRGEQLSQVKTDLASEVKVKLDEGFYRIRATVDDLGGRSLVGQTECVVSDNPEKLIGELVGNARKLQRSPKLRSYAGYVDFLATLIAPELKRKKNASAQLTVRLAELLAHVKDDPEYVKTLRGIQEWAYLCTADGTGQPFTIWIPEKYDAQRQYPLHVLLHGAGGLHHATVREFQRYSGGPIGEEFHVRVLGRGKHSSFTGLGEVDVLEAIAYIQGHWNINADRIHIHGHSMGGGGTFKLATRHPDIFASARVRAGYGVGLPFENMLHLPTYALHSDDDPVVGISLARAATRRGDSLGGKVVMDETTGVGHGTAGYRRGMRRAYMWAMRHSLVRAPRHVRYTALDEVARAAYWVEVIEWGPQGKPASVNARITPDNTLYLTLDNASVLRVDLENSPTDRNAYLNVVINRELVHAIRPPLPRELYVVRSGGSWKVTGTVPTVTNVRLHYPGGAMALYHGEPLMIVWGTQGDKQTNKQIHRAAQSARHNSKPSWPGAPRGGGGFSRGGNQYGLLPGKADKDVTDDDLRKYNLVLIGTAKQNSVVARLMDQLPVAIRDGKAESSDGLVWDLNRRAMGLLHYNPLAPQRLVYWVASESPGFYKPGAPLMNIQSRTAPPDFIITSAESDQIIAARRFDSRWNWEAGYGKSPLLDEAAADDFGYTRFLAETIRRETASDFAIVQTRAGNPPRWSEGETRVMDVVSCQYEHPLIVLEIPGREIVINDRVLKLRKDPAGPRFSPPVDREQIDPERIYRVGMLSEQMMGLLRATHIHYHTFQITDVTVRNAIRRALSGQRAPQ